ncbi:MAG: Lrp/AsnC family transcriptional regulator [Candidatus Aenigmarchaeota archaeon]|nr:Lrp/AsnC family transcriptional regulator [Candidatus Aenigmarchaeota archaeon]
MIDIDEKDKQILNLLQKDGRMTLKEIGKAIGLSIDSTHKRLKKLLESKVVHIGAFIEPKTIGYELISTVSIKLGNASEEEHGAFIDYLVKSPHIIEVISTLGQYDLMVVFIAKSTEELEKIYRSVRHQFKNIIADWESAINLKVHKFEKYSL